MGSYDVTMKETAACKLTILNLKEGVGGQHVGWLQHYINYASLGLKDSVLGSCTVGKSMRSQCSILFQLFLICVYGHKSIRRFGLYLFFSSMFVHRRR